MAYQIKVVSGPSARQAVPVDPNVPFVIGRDRGVQMSVPVDQTISRQHAQVVFENGAWLVRNLSQHGTLMDGQVFNDQRPLQPGSQFQAGATTFVFEEVAAGAIPAPQPGAVPAPAGSTAGQPAAVGGGALAVGGAAGALAGLPSGPVPTPMSGPGEIPFKAIVSGGVAIAKANLVPSLALFAPLFFAQAAAVGLPFLLVVAGINVPFLGLIFIMLSLVLGLATPLLVANYVGAVKRYQETGQKIAIGDLFKFEAAVQKYLVQIIIGIGSMCYLIPGILISLALPIIIDRPGVGLGDAIKGSLAWTKQNILPMLLMWLVFGVLNMLGMIACGFGVLFTLPAIMAGQWLLYQAKRDEIIAAAAEAGIQL